MNKNPPPTAAEAAEELSPGVMTPGVMRLWRALVHTLTIDPMGPPPSTHPKSQIPKPHTLKRAAKRLGEMIHHYYPLPYDTSADPAHVRQLREEIKSAAADLSDAIGIYEHYTGKPVRVECEKACGYYFPAYVSRPPAYTQEDLETLRKMIDMRHPALRNSLQLFSEKKG